jgi:iron complex transport system ATP-binding protein
MPILAVSDLTVRREDTLILDKISWQVTRGEHWVILGANGSGKTSLLSALTGYLTPSAGRIELLSKTYGATDWRDLRRRVGLVSSAVRQRISNDEPALQTIVSGKSAIINFWGNMTAADRRRGMSVLRQIECRSLADRPWLFLSQGERQRLLIGRALMARPPLLILDEPCAGLDPAARENFLHFLQRLGAGKNPPTLVLVTHHVEEIMPVFTHLLLLLEGRVLAGGPIKDVLTSAALSRAFRAPIRLQHRHRRYTLQLSHPPQTSNSVQGRATLLRSRGSLSQTARQEPRPKCDISGLKV